MDVSVIMVNYNTLAMTTAAINRVLELTESIRFEIILVDNASSDGSKEYFERWKDIKYIYSDKNLGFGQANNLAAKQAKGEYLFFLNTDTLLRNNAIKILHQYMTEHLNVGAAGGNLFDGNGIPTISYERMFPGIGHTLNLLSYNFFNYIRFGKNVMFNHTDYPIEVAYISGADLMIPKALFDNLGGFSPKFFMYYEETDLCRRIQSAGYKIHSVPAAEITHLEGGSQQKSTTAKRKTNLRSIKSRAIFFSRNYNKWYIVIEKKLYFLYLYISTRLHNNSFDYKNLSQEYNNELVAIQLHDKNHFT